MTSSSADEEANSHTHEAVAALHHTLKILRDEIIKKNLRIRELEKRLKIEEFDDLFELVPNDEDVGDILMKFVGGEDSVKSKSCTGSQTDITAISDDNYVQLKEWRSEPILINSWNNNRKHPVKHTTHVKFNLPPRPTSLTDVSFFKSLLRNNNDDDDNESDESIDALLEETRDYLSVATHKLMTIDDWDGLNEKKMSRKRKRKQEKSEENMFVPQKISDMKIGYLTRFVFTNALTDGTVTDIDLRGQSLQIAFTCENRTERSNSDDQEDKNCHKKEISIPLSKVIVAWRK